MSIRLLVPRSTRSSTSSTTEARWSAGAVHAAPAPTECDVPRIRSLSARILMAREARCLTGNSRGPTDSHDPAPDRHPRESHRRQACTTRTCDARLGRGCHRRRANFRQAHNREGPPVALFDPLEPAHAARPRPHAVHIGAPRASPRCPAVSIADSPQRLCS